MYPEWFKTETNKSHSVSAPSAPLLLVGQDIIIRLSEPSSGLLFD